MDQFEAIFAQMDIKDKVILSYMQRKMQSHRAIYVK